MSSSDDPLEFLKILADRIPMMRHEPNNMSIELNNIAMKWEEERQSHDVSIDALHDQIAELNKIIAEKENAEEEL